MSAGGEIYQSVSLVYLLCKRNYSFTEPTERIRVFILRIPGLGLFKYWIGYEKCNQMWEHVIRSLYRKTHRKCNNNKVVQYNFYGIVDVGCRWTCWLNKIGH